MEEKGFVVKSPIVGKKTHAGAESRTEGKEVQIRARRAGLVVHVGDP